MTSTPPSTALAARPVPEATGNAFDKRRLLLGVGLAALGGFGVVAAFPPIGLWPLIFVSFVPIAVAQQRVLPARWAGLAPAIGVGIYVAYLAWGGLTAAQRWWLLLLVPLLFVTGSLDRRAQRATGFRHLAWSTPVLWTGALFAVGLTPVASWLDPAYALYRQPWLIQPVSVLAVSGLNLMILLTNYGLAAAALNSRLRMRVVLVIGVASMVTGWVAASAVLLSHGVTGQTVRVAVVQPGRTVHTAATRTKVEAANTAMLAVLADGTRRAANDGAQLVVWPEQALPYISPGDDQWREVQRAATTNHVYLVVGYSPDPYRFNEAAVLDPAGRILAIYNKQHPVTFAGDHSVGGPVVVVHSPVGVIAPIICYDLDFENTARESARKGAQLLAVPSEDWSGIAEQHYTHLVFRAVENRVAAVKADTAWDSVIIDSYGRIHAAKVDTSASGAVLVGTVALGAGKSPFVTTGNWVGWGCLGLTALWFAIAARGLRRR